MSAGRPVLSTGRLALEPLGPEHAEEMAPLLDDVQLHKFTGGTPSSLEELRDRYARWSAGASPDGTQQWCNWIVREREGGAAVGWVQATVAGPSAKRVAEIAWTIAPPFQRRGYAREAAAEAIRWLEGQGAGTIVAHIHPEHAASIAVARALGLVPTAHFVRGEVRWVSDPRA